MAKNVTKRFLLAFVVAAIITQVTKGFQTVHETTFTDGKHLVLFHAKVRCRTCTTMEQHVKQVLDSDFKDELEAGVFDFHVLDYEAPETKRIVEKYKIATATVLIFEQKEGEYGEGVNLAELSWKLVGNESEFKKMVEKHLKDFIQGNKIELESWATDEIELAPDLNLFEKETFDTSKENSQ